MTGPAAPPLPAELDALVRRMRLPYLRKAAPDVLATARAQRWDPAEVLRVLDPESPVARPVRFGDAFVEIEDGSGFVGKVRIARKDPASMFPGAKGIAAEPAPQSGTADLRNQALRNYVLPDLLDRKLVQACHSAPRSSRTG